MGKYWSGAHSIFDLPKELSMRRNLLLISLMAILLMGAKGDPVRRLTVINKSGVPLAISLIPPTRTRAYYLQVPAGDRRLPTETNFTIIVDEYRMRVFYLEENLSHTGFPCRPFQPGRLLMARNIQITVLECDRRPPTRGEPGMYKLGRSGCIK